MFWRRATVGIDEQIRRAMEVFGDGSGFGDPEARRNAELRLQVLLTQRQQEVASRLNWITLGLVAVGILQVVVLAFQVWGN